MSVLAVVLACLACTGHARPVHMTSQGPVYQNGLSRQVGAPQEALAALLLLRGGKVVRDSRGSARVRRSIAESDIDLVHMRGGQSRLRNKRGGFVEAPMAPSRAFGREEVATIGKADIGTGQVAAIRGAAATRKTVVAPPQPKDRSAGQLSKSVAKSDSVLVQGGSLKTWCYRSSLVDNVQVVLTTDGRPLDADVQLWQGPDNTPCKMRVYSENGLLRPFSAVIATPDGGENTVAVRNVGQIEFPLAAFVTANDIDGPISDFRDSSIIVQGGALRTFNFDTSVESVEIMLKTDGRPLNARIELLQGPNNNKQVIELYTEDGFDRPFFAVIDTMGSGNVVRIVNTAPMEFPMTAMVQPHTVDEKMSLTDPVIQ